HPSRQRPVPPFGAGKRPPGKDGFRESRLHCVLCQTVVLTISEKSLICPAEGPLPLRPPIPAFFSETARGFCRTTGRRLPEPNSGRLPARSAAPHVFFFFREGARERFSH